MLGSFTLVVSSTVSAPWHLNTEHRCPHSQAVESCLMANDVRFSERVLLIWRRACYLLILCMRAYVVSESLEELFAHVYYVWIIRTRKQYHVFPSSVLIVHVAAPSRL